LPGPLRSALRVSRPSRRLTPSEPVPVLFRTGGAPGIRPAELSPLGRFPLRFRNEWTHVPFNPSVIPPPKRWAGPTDRGFWAFTRPGVPGGQNMISAPTAGCSLGLHPLRAVRLRPCPGFRPDSSHALHAYRSCDSYTPAPRSFDGLQLGPVRRTRQAEPRTEQPLQGFGTGNSRTCERAATRAMCSPCTSIGHC
jgi:hypothetical protein